MIASQRTLRTIANIIETTPQAILLVGNEGAGKQFVAKHIAAQILQLSRDALDNHQYYLEIEPTKNVISIAEVRRITKHLQLKTIGSQKIRRIVVIADAHTMTTEAQNALLKTLEEPPEDTIILLTSKSKTDLLPTILSRLSSVDIMPLSLQEASELFNEHNLQSSYALSEGNIGTLHALINDSEHPVTSAIQLAKQLLTMKPIQRLASISTIVKDKQSHALLDALMIIARTGKNAASTKSQTAAAQKWNTILAHTLRAKQQLLSNGQNKLVLTNLFINM